MSSYRLFSVVKLHAPTVTFPLPRCSYFNSCPLPSPTQCICTSSMELLTRFYMYLMSPRNNNNKTYLNFVFLNLLMSLHSSFTNNCGHSTIHFCIHNMLQYCTFVNVIHIQKIVSSSQTKSFFLSFK